MGNPHSSEPRGRTLWEMFRGWTKRVGKPDAELDRDKIPAEKDLPNPLDWHAGVPVPLNASHGAEFTDSIIVLEAIRHSDRYVAGKHFRFLDYRVRTTQRKEFKVDRCIIRCLPRMEASMEFWDKFLLRMHDEFAYDSTFEGLLNDPTGVFNIEHPDFGHRSYHRLNGVSEPWEVDALLVTQHLDPLEASRTKPGRQKYRYWDYITTTEEGEEELLFAEIDKDTGWIQLWRGSKFVL